MEIAPAFRRPMIEDRAEGELHRRYSFLGSRPLAPGLAIGADRARPSFRQGAEASSCGATAFFECSEYFSEGAHDTCDIGAAALAAKTSNRYR